MARLFTSGFELADVGNNGTSSTLGPDGVSGGTGNWSLDNIIFRSGKSSIKATRPFSASDVINFNIIGGATSRTYFVRCYIYVQSFPTTQVTVLGFNNLAEIDIDASGNLQVLLPGSGGHFGATTQINLNQWYRVELSLNMASTGGVDDVWQFKLDDVIISSGTNNIGGTAPTAAFIGCASSITALQSYIINFDDFAVNDSTGTIQNTFPGEGKVVLLAPLSDSAIGTGWTDDNSSGVNLFVSVDNIPPSGIADTTIGGGGHQIRNATSNANSNYDVRLQSYASAGIGELDIIKVVVPFISTAAPVATSAKQGTVGFVSNPPIANIALSTDGTSGAFWSGVTAGTYPSGWKWSFGTVTVNPTVALTTNPVMRVTQVTASTRIAMVDYMGAYVEYVQGIQPTLPPATPILIRLAKGMGGKLRRLHNNILIPTLPVSDANTVASATTVLSVDTTDFVDADIPGSATSVSAIEGYSYSDLTTTASSVTTVSGSETTDYVEPQSTDDILLTRFVSTIAATFVVPTTVAANGIVRTSNGLLTQINLKLTQTGTPSDQLNLEVRADDGTGKPSSTILFNNIFTPSVGVNQIILSPPLRIVAGTTYWISLRRTGIINSNCWNWAIMNVGLLSVAEQHTYTGGVLSNSADTGSTWTNSASPINEFDALFIVDVTTPHTVTDPSGSSEIYTPVGGTTYTDADTPGSVTNATSTETTDYVDSDTVASVTSLSTTARTVPQIRAASTYGPSVATTTHNVPVPVGTQAGDILLAYILFPANPNNPIVTFEAGWTQLWQLNTFPQPTNSYTIVCVSRIATNNEPATYKFTSDFSDRPAGVMLAIMNSAGIDVSGSNIATGTTTAYTSPSITPTLDGELVIVLNGASAGGSSTESFTPNASFTEFIDFENTNNHTAVEVEFIQQLFAASISSSATASIVSSPTTGIISFKPITVPTEIYIPYIDRGFTTPLLITLGERIRLFKLLNDNILGETPQVSGGTQYTDSTTISSVTSVQSSESTDFLDTSGAINGTSSVTSTEVVALVDVNTVAGVTSLSSTDVVADVEAATIASVTAVSSVETTDYVETATISSITSLTTIEAYYLQTPLTQPLLIKLAWGRGKLRLLDQTPNPYGVSYAEVVTIATATAVSSTETTDYVESATIASVSSVSSLEEHDIPDSATVSSQSSVISSDIYTVVDPSTGAITTSVISLETAQFSDSSTFSSITVVSSTDVAAYVDSSVVSSITSVSTVELHEIPDSGTVTGSTSVTSADTAQYVDSGALSTTTSLTYTEVAAYIDADAPASITTPSSAEVFTQAPIPASMQVLLIKLARYHRQLKLLGSNTLASPPAAATVYSESATIATVSSVTSTDVAAYVDASTVAGSTTPSATDALTDLDANTAATHTTPSSNDIAAYVDSSTTGSVSTPSSTDFTAYVDSSLISSTTSTQPVEIFGIAEAATLSTTTTLTSGETAQYVDGDTPFVITAISALEAKGLVDTATITGITSLTYTEQFILAPTFIDAATVLTTTTLPHTYEYGPIAAIELVGTATTRWTSSGLYGRYVVVAQKHLIGVAGFNSLIGSMRRRWKI